MCKRALIITDVTAPGGVDTYLCGLYMSAAAAGWKVRVLMDIHPGSNELFEKLKHQGANVQRCRFYHRFHAEDKRAEPVQKAIDDFDPTIIHAVCGAPWTTIVPREIALANHKPLFFTEQYVAEGFTFEGDLGPRIRRLYKSAKAVVAVSKNNAELLQDIYGFNTKSMVVIPNAVRTDVPTKINPIAKEKLLKTNGAPGNKVNAVTVARLANQKGVDILIDSVSHLPGSDRRNIHFSVIGDGPDQAALLKQADRLKIRDCFSFWGWRKNISKLLLAFDLFILPSRSEGQPFALMEALAAKRPVIAAAVSGIPEVLQNGKGGDLFTGESVRGLTKRISSFIADPEPLKEKAKVGCDFVREHHDIKKNMEKTVGLWEKVV